MALIAAPHHATLGSDSGSKTPECATRLAKSHAAPTWGQGAGGKLPDDGLKHHHSVCSIILATNFHGVGYAVSHFCSQVLGGLMQPTHG